MKKRIIIVSLGIIGASLFGVSSLITQTPKVGGIQKVEIVATSTPIEIAAISSPEVLLPRWNGERKLGIQYHVPAKSPSADASTVNAYPLAAKPGMEAGGFEMEVNLPLKPTSNVFQFDLGDTSDMDFFYQPALTVQEIAQGESRPDNVIGSYAVYSKTKKDHVLGQTDYGTGKLYHIYRPKATDAKGNWTWGDLNVTGSTLTVTIPQSFLDGAVYPVVVDPTLGLTTQGASSVNLAGGSASTQEVGKFTLSGASANITALHAWIFSSTASAKTVFLGMYKADGVVGDAGSPGTLLTTLNGVPISITNTTAADIGVSASAPVLPAADYWIGLVPNEDGPGAATVTVAFDSGGLDIPVGEGTFSNPFQCGISGCTTTGVGTKKLSVYAVFTAINVAITTIASTLASTKGCTFNATVSLNVNNDITQSGFAYSLDPLLLTGVSTTTLGSFSTTGTLSQAVTGLTAGSTYYYRGYVTSTGDGTLYGGTQPCAVTPIAKMFMSTSSLIMPQGGTLIIH